MTLETRISYISSQIPEKLTMLQPSCSLRALVVQAGWAFALQGEASGAGERTLTMPSTEEAKSRVLGDDGADGTGLGLQLGAGVESLILKLLPS